MARRVFTPHLGRIGATKDINLTAFSRILIKCVITKHLVGWYLLYHMDFHQSSNQIPNHLLCIICSTVVLHTLPLGLVLVVLRADLSTTLYYLEAWFHSHDILLPSFPLCLFGELCTMPASVSCQHELMASCFHIVHIFCGIVLLFGR